MCIKLKSEADYTKAVQEAEIWFGDCLFLIVRCKSQNPSVYICAKWVFFWWVVTARDAAACVCFVLKYKTKKYAQPL